MIAGSMAVATPAWARALAAAVTDPQELLALLKLPEDKACPAGFPLRVPRGYVARMRPGDLEDPLFRQVWPAGAEAQVVTGYGPDPVGDRAACRAPGLLQKYAGRALLSLTGACAIHCRYCFRRHFPYGEENPLGHAWPGTLAALRQIENLREVILSGGDPLMLSDARLAAVVSDLQALPGLRRLRIHTRLPVVLPERVDTPFCTWLAGLAVPVVIVLHANHAQELNGEVLSACRALTAAGATLLNQSVLLKGVNDSAAVLAALSEALFDAGVLPYYLHQLDPVAGAAHFAVPDDRARALNAELAGLLPGYLVPRLVREIPGMRSKTAVC